MTKYYRQPKHYCWLADLQVAPFLTQAEFRRSLLGHLLFQGSYVIPDGFWFSSPPLIEEIKRPPEQNWILECLRAGLLRPAFREPGTKSFVRGYEVVREQGILGPTEEALDLARILDRGLRGKSSYRPNSWPRSSVGARFLDLVRATLGADQPPLDGDDIAAVWEATKRWRIECVDDAVERTSDRTLQRGQLLDVVARTLGYSDPKGILNAGELLRRYGVRHGPTLIPFVHWVNQCYQFNQGRAFGIVPSVFSGTKLGPIGIQALLQSEQTATRFECLALSAPIPSIDRLSELPPAAVIQTRRSGAGRDYFRELARWTHDPTAVHTAALVAALHRYCDALRHAFVFAGGGLPDWIEATFGIGRTDRARQWINYLGRTTLSGLQLWTPIGLMAFAYKAAHGALRIVAPRSAYAVEQRLRRLKERGASLREPFEFVVTSKKLPAQRAEVAVE